MEIQFNEVAQEGIRVLIGQDKGSAVRNKLRVDDLDKLSEEIVFIIPASLKTMTPSFVQGLFAASVWFLGERGFFEKYRFQATPQIVSDIRAGIDRVLTSRHLSGA